MRKVFVKPHIQLVATDRPQHFNVRLFLPGETRIIGVLDESGDGTFWSIRKESHIYRIDSSLGINHELLTSESIHFKWIVLQLPGRLLVTSRQYFIQKGHFLNFGKKGFELQIFLPISEFGLPKAREFEADLLKKRISKEPDLSLFGEVS